jgi:mono/diheme cytochrome c family protein
MRTIVCGVACVLVLLSTATATAQSTKAPKRDADVERGRYLVKIGGCNDCHTVNYPETAGAVPEKDWLTGVPVGWQGPWGTTYSANLRLVIGSMTEAQWMTRARQPMRPPMPWFALRDMTDNDVRAIYRYLKSLGPAGQPVPAYVPPGGNVATPVIVFVPQNLPAPAK